MQETSTDDPRRNRSNTTEDRDTNAGYQNNNAPYYGNYYNNQGQTYQTGDANINYYWPNHAPHNQSPQYQHFWASPDAFKPQQFSENTVEIRKFNNPVFAVLFFIQFLISLSFFLHLLVGSESSLVKGSSFLSFNRDTIIVFVTSLIIALVFNIAHFFYAVLIPRQYIIIGLVVGFVLTILSAISLWISARDLSVLIFPAIGLIYTLVIYWFMRKYIKFSSCVFYQTCRLIVRNPCILGFTFLGFVVSALVCTFFLVAIGLTSNGDLFMLIWFIFSFFWTFLTVYYVIYLTIAGFAGTWYFLTDTQYYPDSPVWQSFKRASTTSLGSASIAAFFLALVKTIKFLISICDPESSCGSIVYCVALCLISIIEMLVIEINAYGLIYCALFGVPFGEGCIRFLRMDGQGLCRTLLSSCCISTAVNYNMVIFVFVAALAGLLAGYLIFYKNTENTGDGMDLMIFTLCYSGSFTLGLFFVVAPLLITISDTIFVCYAEHPERLKTTASELDDVFNRLYQGNVF